MPMAFAAILASSMTLIATSTNVVVSGLMVQFGLPPIGMFELTPVGLPVLVVGILYMVLVGQRLIPVRRLPQTLTETFEMRPYLAELRLLPGSDLVGKSLLETGAGRLLNLTVLVIIRGDQRISPDATTTLEAGDALLVEGSYDAILKVKDLLGIAIQADLKFSDADLQAGDLRLAEAVLLPGSMFLRRTIKDLQLREKYHLQVLAINHHSGMVHEKIADTRLSMGDVLLVQSSHETLAALHGKRHISVLGMVDVERFNRKQAWIVVSIFAGAIVAGATGLLPLPVAMLLGALVVLPHPQHHPRRSLPARGLARADPDRLDAGAGRGNAVHRHGAVPCRSPGNPAGRRQPAVAAQRLFRAHRAAHPADVQPGCRRGGDPAGAADRRAARPQPTHLRHNDRHRRQHLLPHPAGARLPDGLRTWALPLPRFRQGGRLAHPADLPARHRPGAAALAVEISPSYYPCAARSGAGSRLIPDGGDFLRMRLDVRYIYQS